ncbi:unnamed protein product, partial [Ectocarpus fasciculatus]
YGYVRPARVALDTNTAAATAAGPPGVPSVARSPARAKTGGRPTANGCHKSRPHQCETSGAGGAGVVAAGDDGAATAGSGATAGTEKEGDAESGDGPEAGGVITAAEAFAGSGAAGGGDGESEEEEEEEGASADGVAAVADGAASGTGGVSTPVRATPTLAVPEEREEEEEKEPGSPPTPASPGLADWEITEGAREMLRRAQPQQQQQQDQSERSGSSDATAAAAAPRSLEALLAENSAVSGGSSRGGGGGGGGGNRGGGGRRSSVSSDWSPPPSSTTEAALSRSSSRRQQRRRSCGVGVGRVDDGAPSENSGGAGATDTPTTGGGEMSLWGGSSSNPPTPARLKFEGWTPEERDTAEVGGDRMSSTGTPSLGFASPLNNDVTASLIETALSGGKRQDVASTPSEESACHSVSAVITRPKPTPIKRVSLQGNEASVTGSLPKGPRGDFWGNASPESSVVASSRENTAEHRPDPPHSPETPATPRMLSPRFLVESASGGDNSGPGGGAASACSSGRVTRSASRAMEVVARKAADGPGDVDADVNATDCCGSDHDDRGSSDGFDSDVCPTPELSSPLRSATVSVRDLQVLTPSAKVNTGDAGGGYSGGSAYNYDDNDDEDSDMCPTPELSSPLRSAGSAALCRRRLEEADGEGRSGDDEVAGVEGSGGPLDFVSEEEYARAPKFLTIQVSRSVLNETIGNLNAYAAPRLASPSELLLTVDEIMGIIDQGDLSRTLLLSAAHLKRIEV